ncbi:MAG: 50S ribosomal protein L25 [Patescibacteria group bacterium]
MQNHILLTAILRDLTGRKTESLRQEGKVPAVLYGFGTEPMNITVDRNAFIKVFASAGASTVVDLTVGEKMFQVLISDTQRNPLNDFFTHIDFRAVDPNRRIEAKIPLVLAGVAPAVKELGGTLLQTLEEVEVISLPNALVHEISVDVSRLKTFEDVIRVSDIIAPEGVEITTDVEVAIASVQPPRSEEELASLNAAVELDVSKVEVTTEKKEEATEGTEVKKDTKKDSKK